jgi:ribosome-associated heat shock protein Hsp15
MDGTSPSGGSVRIDRWLCAARIFKSRTQAHEACEAGHVRINDLGAKPSHAVKVGDTIRCHSPRGMTVVVVTKLGEKRLAAALARELYEDHSPPPPPKEERIPVGLRDRGTGRPTKADRRATERFRRGW